MIINSSLSTIAFLVIRVSGREWTMEVLSLASDLWLLFQGEGRFWSITKIASVGDVLASHPRNKILVCFLPCSRTGTQLCSE